MKLKKLFSMLLAAALLLSPVALMEEEQAIQFDVAQDEGTVEGTGADVVPVSMACEDVQDSEVVVISSESIVEQALGDTVPVEQEEILPAEEASVIVSSTVQEIETESEALAEPETDAEQKKPESGDDTFESPEPPLESSDCVAVSNASSLLRRPKDVDNGYWVNAYKHYLDQYSRDIRYAMLADLDFDGRPELIVIDESWPHVGACGAIVKYTGSSYIVNNYRSLFQWGEKLYLTLNNGQYTWFRYYTYSNQGNSDKHIDRIYFNGSMNSSEDVWIHYGWNCDGSEGGWKSYSIGGREVSKSEYNREMAKWNQMPKLFALDLEAYPYPSKWNSAIKQYSVLCSSASIPSIYAGSKSNKTTVSMAAGKVYVLDLGDSAGKSFKSSKTKVATVDSIGVVTIKGVGSTTITFKVSNTTRKLTLKVIDPTIPTSVSLNMSGTVNVYKGSSITLTAQLPTGTYSGIKWQTSNDRIATVKNGLVTFKKTGTVTITATTTRGKKKAKVKFKVEKQPEQPDQPVQPRFGDWSAWSTTPVSGNANREVQTEVRRVQTGTKTIYNYNRFLYKNPSLSYYMASYGSYWATSKGYPGNWQYVSTETRYSVDHLTDGQNVYYGETRDGNHWWYNESTTTEPIYGDVTYYRYRDKIQ